MGQPPNLGHRQGKVWITRASPGAEASAERAAALGFDCIVAPLLTFRSIAAELHLRLGETLAFTSINGVERTAAMTDRRDPEVFAVGDATAKAARAAGFRDVASAAGDVQALGDLIVRAAPTAVLHPCARQTAGDLVGALKAAGVSARKLPVYETVEAVDLPASVATALGRHELSAILIHSPKAAKTAAALLGGQGDALAAVCGIGLSPACIEPLRALPFQTLVAAPVPTEKALMRALGDLAVRRHG
jgi:uroporphyrinogen-III synthase